MYSVKNGETYGGQRRWMSGRESKIRPQKYRMHYALVFGLYENVCHAGHREH